MKVQETVANKVYTILRERILSGFYQPSDKLNERILSEELNFSRTPIRESIRRLELEGLVVSIPFQGAEVAFVDVEDAEKIYDLHGVIEGLAIKEAALNLTKQDIINLEDNIEASEKEFQLFNIQNLVLINKEFHAIIYECSGNPYIIDAVKNIQNKASVLRITTLSDKERAKENIMEHKAIVQALKKRDYLLCEALGISHLRNAAKTAKKLLRK